MSHHVEFRLRLRRDARGRKRLSSSTAPTPPREHLPRITRLLALAHRWNRLVGEGTVANYAEIARLMGLSRARVTQIVDLTLLDPSIQEEILSGELDVPETYVRRIIRVQEWAEQRRIWSDLRSPDDLQHPSR